MVALEFWGFKIYWYGIFYFISVILFYFYLNYIISKGKLDNYQHLKKNLINNKDDLIFYIVLGIIFGGRLGYVLIYNLDYYVAHPIEIFYIWQGGMSFVGGVLGVFIGIFIFKKIFKIGNLEFILLGDIMLSYLPFGIGMGRLGNYLNQELYGRQISQLFHNILINYEDILIKLNIIKIYSRVDNNLRINSNLLELLFEGIFLLIILQFYLGNKQKIKSENIGKITGIFFVFYGIIRFNLEYLREFYQANYFGYFNNSQIFMILFVLIGSYFIISQSRF